MKDRTLLYYLEANQDTLLPPSTMTAPINSKEWYVKLKEHFNDLIWLYYSDRTVFINDRFKLEDTDERTILNIMRSFAINLKTKNYEYENLYNSTVLEFNPLWNVDGVEGTIREYTTNVDRKDDHKGTDSLTRDMAKTFNNYNINSVETIKNDVTTTENYVNTYDSGNTDYPSNRSVVSHTGQLNPPETTTDTTHTGSISDGGTDITGYNSYHEINDDTAHKELEMHIRQGNIGVTKSTELVEDYRNLAMYDFFKLVVRECVNTCTYAVE